MSYADDEKEKAVDRRTDLFCDPGGGVFRKQERDFVLTDPTLNLWCGIRDDALNYFREHDITWWMGGTENQPTGHLLSSQIACLNHLYLLRQREDAATAVLQNLDPDIEEAQYLEDGYVGFEVIGRENYLGERSHTRGANATSIDAVMVGRKPSGKNLLIAIEWKYTESYSEEDKYVPERARVYDGLLNEEDSPVSTADVSALYYEPFYQLMRQTLLASKMVAAGEYDCDDYLHVHVIPRGNSKLRETITSPPLRTAGTNMSQAWKSALKEPSRYVVLTPQEFLQPAGESNDTRSIMNYLSKRYWE